MVQSTLVNWRRPLTMWRSMVTAALWPTLAAALCLTLAGCGQGADAGGTALISEQSDAGQSLGGAGGGGGGRGEADTAALQDAAPPSKLGNDCEADASCGGEGVCYRGLCVKTCLKVADCATGEDCSVDAGGRMVCVKPAYHEAIGQLCGTDGKCPEGTQCLGVPYSAFAACSASCNDDTDCPMTEACVATADAKVCLARKFCSGCQHDGNCGAGLACIEDGGQRFCAKACNAGSTECPRYAACKDVGGGDHRCVHKAGTCVGDGSLCQPCFTDSECDGACLTYNHTKESFCASDCGASCPSGYVCSASIKKCVPADNKNPTCVKPLAKMAEVGDVMDDYTMIGMVDTNEDGLLTDEAPRVIRFSDFAKHHELILFNVSAVWCSACQAETKDMRPLYKTYFPKGLVMVQTLFDGQKPGDPMTMGLLKAWNSQLKPSGYVGMDPERWVLQYNIAGSTPLNMIIDAKTRKVLHKVNGYNKVTLQSAINKAFKDKGL